MNEMKKMDNIVVIAATNRPDDLDPAVLRRFDVWVEVPLPDTEERYMLLSHMLEDIEHSVTPAELKVIAEKTSQCSRSDLAAIMREVAMKPLRELQLTPAMLQNPTSAAPSAVQAQSKHCPSLAQADHCCVQARLRHTSDPLC